MFLHALMHIGRILISEDKYFTFEIKYFNVIYLLPMF